MELIDQKGDVSSKDVSMNTSSSQTISFEVLNTYLHLCIRVSLQENIKV